MFIVAPVFKGTTINKKMRLDHDSLSRPETRMLKWLGYQVRGCIVQKIAIAALFVKMSITV